MKLINTPTSIGAHIYVKLCYGFKKNKFLIQASSVSKLVNVVKVTVNKFLSAISNSIAKQSF